MSTVDTTLASPIRPFFEPSPATTESTSVRHLIAKLHLQKHPEGGYFFETDRDQSRVPNPFQSSSDGTDDDSSRSACTTIYYLLTPASPTGHSHRFKARTIHTLHKGRGRYVIIREDEREKGEKAKLESFVVGHDIHGDERVQWIVEGGNATRAFYCQMRKTAWRAKVC